MIVAAVPLKRLSAAKSRLAPGLSAQERVALMLRLVERTVRTLRESEVVDSIALVTTERELAERLKVDWLPDRGGLNVSLLSAVEWAIDSHAATLLIIPADLPRLSTSDIRMAVGSRLAGAGISVARTHDGGTGLLLLSPPNALTPAFGIGSYQRHLDGALAQGIMIAELGAEAPGFHEDLDTIADLESAYRGSQ